MTIGAQHFSDLKEKYVLIQTRAFTENSAYAGKVEGYESLGGGQSVILNPGFPTKQPNMQYRDSQGHFLDANDIKNNSVGKRVLIALEDIVSCMEIE